MRELLQRVRLDLPALARRSGLTVGYLKQLSSGKRGAGPGTREKLAAALESHARQLDADALLLRGDGMVEAEAAEGGADAPVATVAEPNPVRPYSKEEQVRTSKKRGGNA